jgi:hypothetical protein
MSDDDNSLGFGKFVPGFDFLQNLAKGSPMPQMPNLSSWVAPTLSVEELQKRISDLKAVHFWLDQNAKALGATIQALEVQKMTLATLQGMNFSMADMADAMKLKPGTTAAPARPPEQPAEKAGDEKAAAGVIDPLQWWGALTQQFQQIAATAMKDVAAQTVAMTAPVADADTAKDTATPARKTAAKRSTRKPAAH